MDDFDVVGKTPAQQFAAAGRFLGAHLEAVPVGELERAVHVLFVFAAVIDRADGVGVRHHVRRNEVLAAQLELVETEFARGLLDKTLDRVGYFWPAGTAVGLCAHRIGKDGAGAQRRHRNVIGAGDETGSLAKRRERHAAATDIAQIVRPHRQERAFAIKRQFNLGDEVSALIVRKKCLGTCCRVFDRPPDLLRCPKHQTEFHIDAIARAEISADIV